MKNKIKISFNSSFSKSNFELINYQNQLFLKKKFSEPKDRDFEAIQKNNFFKNKIWDEKLMLSSEYSGLSVLQEHIKVWMKKGIKVNIFINPYHEEYYTTMAEHDLLDSFNTWRILMRNIFSSKINFCDFLKVP